MSTLISTIGNGDADKVLLAMKRLPYDDLVLLCEDDPEQIDDIRAIRELEHMSGHEVVAYRVEDGSLLSLVDELSDILAGLMLDRSANRRKHLVLNISGGSKLLGDAALLAAFRLGIEAYHCENRVTKLPVLSGATPKDRFTQNQIRLIRELGDRWMPLADAIDRMGPMSKPATERVIRELRKQGLLQSELREGQVRIALSSSGVEVWKATTLAESSSG